MEPMYGDDEFAAHEPTLPVQVPEARVLVRRMAGGGNVFLPQYGVEVWEGELWHVNPDEVTPLRGWEAVPDDEARKLIKRGDVVLVAGEAKSAMPVPPEPPPPPPTQASPLEGGQ